MFEEVEEKIKKKRQILFTRQSPCLGELRELFCRQNHLTAVLWAFDCLQAPLRELTDKYPHRGEIPAAYAMSLAWAHGEIKMPMAQRAILDCHASAKQFEDARDIALCHAVGQGCSTVHVETHALGLAFYELTAVVIGCDYHDYEEAVMKKIEEYNTKLKWWQQHEPDYRRKETWAAFLTRPDQENKEKRLMRKQQTL